ncbi:hypothetical protein QNA24_29990 [Rhodococcus qingshengii]|uniref:hypothetical protein n=1 Tax=Rhodococcus TaxID=1827 RepID=UPI001E3B0963|nr:MULTISPECIES: hypothetical protein [Rhodococcus]MCD2099601.1 hypothetical protein [Rhodococcus rhodochrous]MCD2123969.1 hypothetical protein [Rhodococcus rhodochrous]MCQ4136600.1 hypothetical protein [Rhodococcus rhodochrous]MDJ0490615.1 hypothetical protein [Rhodococcus qingshengii]
MTPKDAKPHPIIRAVPDAEPEPILSVEELQKTGNKIVAELRRQAFRAIQLSMNEKYLGQSFTVGQLGLMQRQAEEAAEAWQRTAAIAAGLREQVQRTKDAHL